MGYPVEQRRRIACHPGRYRKHRRMVGRDAIDDVQAGLGGCAVAGIDAAVDRSREHDAASFLQTDEAIAPGWIVGREIRAGDGDEAAAIGETRQRRRHVAQRSVGDAPVDVGSGREGRIHQHDGRAHGGVEMVVNMSRVVPRDGDARKQAVEQIAAGICEFVENEPRAVEFGMDGEQSGPSGRLQHQVGRLDRGGSAGDETERNRRGELLQRVAFLGPARVGRNQRRELRQHGEEA